MRFGRDLAVMAAVALAVYVAWHLLQPGRYALQDQDHDEIMTSVTASAPQRTISVLFVGNSLTFVHDVPAMLVNIASADPQNTTQISVQAVTRGGASLDQMLAQTNAADWVRSHHPDFVVLQERSRWYDGAEDYARQDLSDWMDALRPIGAAALLFEVWADGDGSDSYTNSASVAFGHTPKQDAEIAADKSQTLAQEYHLSLVRVGEAFERAREMSGAPDVYGPDHHHASAAGAYLAALVFYQHLTGRTGAESTYRPWGVGADDKVKLVHAASGGG